MSETIGHDGPSGTGDDGPVCWSRSATPVRGVAVALNRAVLPRSAWQTKLSDGARLQVLTAVQGG